jgi:uncharacterized protein YwgA
MRRVAGDDAPCGQRLCKECVMDKQSLLLAALSAGGTYQYTPVQVQKLIFLIERNVASDLGGQAFEFKAYDYGPFDSSIYEVLREIEDQGLAISSATTRGWKKYQLTEPGAAKGSRLLSQLPKRAADYVRSVSEFVRRLSFAELVSSIYKAYPEMKANSVFRE